MKTVDYTLYFITNSDGYDEETFLNKVKGGMSWWCNHYTAS